MHMPKVSRVPDRRLEDAGARKCDPLDFRENGAKEYLAQSREWRSNRYDVRVSVVPRMAKAERR